MRQVERYWRKFSAHLLASLIAWTVFGSVALAATAGSIPNCSALFESLSIQVQGKTVPVLRSPTEWRIATQRLSDYFPEPNEVFLGYQDPHHFYLIVGKERYDGDILKPGRLTADAMADRIRPGFLIHFRDLPEDSVLRISEAIKENPEYVTFSCVNAACEKLSAGGVRFRNVDNPPFLLSNTVNRILTNDLLGPDGKPVEFDVILNSNTAPEELFADLDRFDKVLYRKTKMTFKDASIEQIMRIGPMNESTQSVIMAVARKAGISGAAGVSLWVFVAGGDPQGASR